MKPGIYWVEYTPKYEPEDKTTTVCELQSDGSWWLIGCDCPVDDDEVKIIKEIERP